MSTFNYTKDRPSESTFGDIQSLNKFSEAVSCAHLAFSIYSLWKLAVDLILTIVCPANNKVIKIYRKCGNRWPQIYFSTLQVRNYLERV